MAQFRLHPRAGPDLLSIVVPVLNEEDVVALFVDEMSSEMDRLSQPVEFVFVNDGSTDDTLAAIDEIARTDPRITSVNLSRHYGKEIATTAGLAHAKGDAVVIIDVDLQEPPEVIATFIAHYREGYDVVFGRRRSRDGETRLKILTARAFYRLMRYFGPVDLPAQVGDFGLLSRKATDAVLAMPEHHRFMKGLFAWIGFARIEVPYDRRPRAAGDTKWTYFKLFNLSIEGITSFTTAPLRFITLTGMVIAVVSIVYGTIVLGRTLLVGDPVPGFPTLFIAILFLGAIQLIAIGMIGEYLARIFTEAKSRPLYFVESVRWSHETDPADHAQIPDTLPLPPKRRRH